MRVTEKVLRWFDNPRQFRSKALALDDNMKKTLTVLTVLILVGWGVSNHQSTVFAQSSLVQELEVENAELREKLDNIRNLVSEEKSDLDDVENDVQSDDPCDDTNAYSNASDVEDKLSEIEAEASY